MARIKYFAAALLFTACAGNVPANNAIAANTVQRTTPAAPTKDALVTLEKSAYEAWKSKDAKFWDTFLSDKFIGYGSFGRLDKASATKQYSGTDCEIKSYAVSDEQVQPLGNEAALITHKTTVDGTCNGREVPPSSWVASVYVRDGDRWKGAFHAEAPVVDPKAAPAKSVDVNETSQKDEAKSADRDAGTDAMLAVEKILWEAWRTHDAKKIDDLTARDISFINIFGTHFATKADALKDWSGTYCDVKSISFTDVAGTMLSPTVGILTFKATADGTCYGQKVGPVWARRSTLSMAMCGSGPLASIYPHEAKALKGCRRVAARNFNRDPRWVSMTTHRKSAADAALFCFYPKSVCLDGKSLRVDGFVQGGVLVYLLVPAVGLL